MCLCCHFNYLNFSYAASNSAIDGVEISDARR